MKSTWLAQRFRQLTGRQIGGALALFALVILYLMGWLLPIVRLALAVVLLVAVAGGVWSFFRALWITLHRSEKSEAIDLGVPKVVGITCGLGALGCALLLQLIRPATSIEGELPRAVQRVTASQPPNQRSATVSTRVPSTSSSNSRTRQNEEVADFFGALIQTGMQQQAAEQQQRYQQFQGAIQEAGRCGRCGGAGSYRFVDQFGQLQHNQCPSCLGSGRAY